MAAVNALFLQALLAFLALPGIVAFAVPLLMAGSRERIDPAGVIVVILGSLLLVWCVRDFYVSGKGTLAPWTPPKHLVVSGPYRISRNPMYVAVQIVLWGWALTFRSRPLVVYALVVLAAFQLRVVLGEEPWLERTHGEAWRRYRAAVPRWLGSVRGPPA